MTRPLINYNKCSDRIMGVKLPALLGNNDRPTVQLTDRPTDRQADRQTRS